MLISLRNITLCQDDLEILNNVSFRVEENDFIYLVGKVGSGKSSLLKALYGELPIKGEEASILGYNLFKLKRKQIPLLRRNLGMVFQDFSLMHELTVEQNLDFVLHATGWKKKTRLERILEVLKLVGMEHKLKSYPHELSGGESQRVSIARALLNRPKIILADEPIGSLDPETSRGIMTLLSQIREEGTAVVMVTHNLSLLTEFPGIVYRLADGTMTEATAEYSRPVELEN